MRTIILVGFIILTGCATTSLVRKNFTPKRGGVAKYLNEGAQFIIDSRKKSAGNDMRKFCGGKFNILSEGNNSETQGYSQYGNTAYAMSSNYIYVSFECVDQTATASGY